MLRSSKSRNLKNLILSRRNLKGQKIATSGKKMSASSRSAGAIVALSYIRVKDPKVK